jgi:hypothetical protein
LKEFKSIITGEYVKGLVDEEENTSMKFDIVSFSKISYRQLVEGLVSPCAHIYDDRNLEIYQEIQYFKVY